MDELAEDAAKKGWAVLPADEPGILSVQCSSKNGFFASYMTPATALALSALLKREAEKLLVAEASSDCRTQDV